MEKWVSTKEVMPELGRFYWISDGKDVALAKWDIERMQWKMLYMYAVVKPTLMLKVKLPGLPAPDKQDDGGV